MEDMWNDEDSSENTTDEDVFKEQENQLYSNYKKR